MSTNYVTHGGRDDSLYFDDDRRMCGTCNEIKTLDMFQKRRHHQKVIYSVDCRACVKEVRETQETAAKTDILATALAKATGRRALMDAMPKSSDAIKRVAEKMGGIDAMWDLVGDTLKKTMECDDERTAIKGANAVIAFQTRAEKNAGAPIDLSELTDEDRMMILMEPAKEMILESAEFRRTLLDFPDIRAVLLAEVGKEVLTIESE